MNTDLFIPFDVITTTNNSRTKMIQNAPPRGFFGSLWTITQPIEKIYSAFERAGNFLFSMLI